MNVIHCLGRAALLLALCLSATMLALAAPPSAATHEIAWTRHSTADRLTSIAYTRDAVGNRTGLTVNGVQTTSAFDAANRLTQAGGTTYSYDTNGHELTKTAGGVTTTYGYDLLNRLTSIGGPSTASYQYNGDGLRTSKAVNGTTTTYAWDPTGLGTVLGDGTGEYLWGQGLVSQVTASATTYVQSDGQGGVRLLTDSGGNVAGRQGFDAYGASRSQSGSQLPFGYTGEQTDAESGLVYLRARYLDPSTGRFLTRDSYGGATGNPQSLNRYSYAEGNPVANTDPSGRCLGPFLIACVAAVLEAVPEITALGVALVSSPILVTMLESSVAGAQANVDTLLCPNASSEDKLGAAASLGLAAFAVLPGDSVARIMPLPKAVSWGKLETLARHFRDHGGDFGATTAGEYANQASEFLQRSQREGLPTKIDAQGVIRTFDPKTNEFGAYIPDGTTRTYFSPRRGQAYFDDQPGSPPR